MGKISGYPEDTNLTGDEKVIGSDVGPAKETRQISVASLADYVKNNLGDFAASPPYPFSSTNIKTGDLVYGQLPNINGGAFCFGISLVDGPISAPEHINIKMG